MFNRIALEEISRRRHDLGQRKNNDYAGKDGNIDNIGTLGVRGIAVRLYDKACRLISLTNGNTEQKVMDESIKDTLLDAANYAEYGVSILEGTWNPKEISDSKIGLSATEALKRREKLNKSMTESFRKSIGKAPSYFFDESDYINKFFSMKNRDNFTISSTERTAFKNDDLEEEFLKTQLEELADDEPLDIKIKQPNSIVEDLENYFNGEAQFQEDLKLIKSKFPKHSAITLRQHNGIYKLGLVIDNISFKELSTNIESLIKKMERRIELYETSYKIEKGSWPNED